MLLQNFSAMVTPFLLSLFETRFPFLKNVEHNDSNVLHCHFQRVLNDWSAAFFTIFKLGPLQLGEINSKAPTSKLDKLVSIDEYLDGYLMERRNRYGKKMEVLIIFSIANVHVLF